MSARHWNVQGQGIKCLNNFPNKKGLALKINEDADLLIKIFIRQFDWEGEEGTEHAQNIVFGKQFMLCKEIVSAKVRLKGIIKKNACFQSEKNKTM